MRHGLLSQTRHYVKTYLEICQGTLALETNKQEVRDNVNIAGQK